MGSPQSPSPQQVKELEAAGQLQLYSSPEWVTVKNGEAVLKMDLPRQAVSLLQYSW
jgi:xylan 1,4-beta-xylosidase